MLGSCYPRLPACELRRRMPPGQASWQLAATISAPVARRNSKQFLLSAKCKRLCPVPGCAGKRLLRARPRVRSRRLESEAASSPLGPTWSLPAPLLAHYERLSAARAKQQTVLADLGSQAPTGVAGSGNGSGRTSALCCYLRCSLQPGRRSRARHLRSRPQTGLRRAPSGAFGRPLFSGPSVLLADCPLSSIAD